MIPLWFTRDWLRVCMAVLYIFSSAESIAQKSAEWKLEKMPAELETDFALSALPTHLRAEATVYLLDPDKGYYLAHTGSNGFVCFVARTEWEWGIFSKDIATPVSYDEQGAKTIFIVYKDVEAMRASGKFTARQIKDSVIHRINKAIYTAPKPGISYMLGPIMRNYAGDPGDTMVKTMSGPHYMFYAPYLTNADIGNLPSAEPRGPVVVNAGGTVLGERKGPFGYIILPAGVMERAKILDDSKELVKRLVEYKPYFNIDHNSMHH